MNNFENDPRRKQELRARPFWDDVYRQVFGDIDGYRFHEEEAYMDKRYAIDVQLTDRCTALLRWGQEKALHHKYAHFNSLTVEYMQDPTTGEKGDWFKLPVQFYAVGYLNEHQDAFEKWIIVNWLTIVDLTCRGELAWRLNSNNGFARANFKYINWNQIPSHAIVEQRLYPTVNDIDDAEASRRFGTPEHAL